MGQDPWGNTKAGFSLTGEIDREDWGLTWNVALEGGGVLVSKKVKLEIETQIKQR
jgi:polyisoprenoid-binding protein YceI